LKEIPGIEVCSTRGAFYIFPAIKSYFGKSDGETPIQNSSDVSMYLLNKAHVSTVAGNAFGDDDCIRIPLPTVCRILKKAFSRIKETLMKLK
jgi:aspartate aminotransferase